MCSMGLVGSLINKDPSVNQQATSWRRRVCGNPGFWEKPLVLRIMNIKRTCHYHCHWQSVRNNSQAGMNWSSEMCYYLPCWKRREDKCSWEESLFYALNNSIGNFLERSCRLFTSTMLLLKYVGVPPVKITQSTFTFLIWCTAFCLKLLLGKALSKREENWMRYVISLILGLLLAQEKALCYSSGIRQLSTIWEI